MTKAAAWLLCGWVLFSMDSQPDGTYLYKPLEAFTTDAPCRQAVRTLTGRVSLVPGEAAPPVGLLAWYVMPEDRRSWRGCWPKGYDPYERR